MMLKPYDWIFIGTPILVAILFRQHLYVPSVGLAFFLAALAVYLLIAALLSLNFPQHCIWMLRPRSLIVGNDIFEVNYGKNRECIGLSCLCYSR